METGSWGDYSKLVLKELERLNESQDKMRSDLDSKFSELNTKLSEVKNLEHRVESNTSWLERVNDVWSPTQMKEAKDELYNQKNRWVAAIAIITFVQVAIGIAVTIWVKMK